MTNSYVACYANGENLIVDVRTSSFYNIFRPLPTNRDDLGLLNGSVPELTDKIAELAKAHFKKSAVRVRGGDPAHIEIRNYGSITGFYQALLDFRST